LGDKRQHLLPGEPLFDDDVPMDIDAMDAHHKQLPENLSRKGFVPIRG